MRIVLLVAALSLAAGAVVSIGCAPRMNKSHFARWAEQDQQRRVERENQEKVEAWMRSQAGVAAPAESNKGAPASTPRMSSGDTTRATGKRDTPPITSSRTSTKASRVIKPSDANQEPDDDAVY